MLSRIAEDLFWIGRYVERAENVARFVDVHYHARLERGASGEDLGWEPIVAVSGDLDLFRVRYGEFSEENVLAFLATDPECPNSILSCLGRARDNARGIRSRLSVEMWEELNKFHLFVQAARSAGIAAGGAPHAFFREVKTRAYLCAGVADATLLHDEGWHFLRAGTFLERIAQTARLTSLQTHLLLREGGGRPHQWIALLKSCSAFEAYGRVFTAGFVPERALDLLLLHREFPRSVYFAAAEVNAALRAILGSGTDRYRTQAEREAARLQNRLAVATVEDIWTDNPEAYVAGIVGAAQRIGDAIARDFFTGRVPVPEGEGRP